ncbi:MAG: hypothetical protein ACOYYS_09445 [Chloroflexota bacterium]
MDGNFLLQSKNWFLENVNQVKPFRSASVHITDLSTLIIPDKSVIPVAFAAFATIINESKQVEEPVRITLVFPLRLMRNKLSLQIPKDWQSIQADFSDEPPIIYLESWETTKRYVLVEEYKLPLKLDLPIDCNANFFTYYREHRYEMEMINDWEFSRCIYIEYYPNGKFAT